ncbi:MAG TPA: hypothetical protein VER33_11680 [Polyangiaceae bacterium]|nr:hypothetical protein [Polyangiaceae bacterium]
MRDSIGYVAIGCLALLQACSATDDPDGAAAGGSMSATGGTPSTSSGGTPSTSNGGTPSTSTGGTPSTGNGGTGNGGTPATSGGTPGAMGGSSAIGGTATSGGSSGAGGTPSAGSGGSSGAPAVFTKSYTFDTDLETWKTQYTSSAPMVPLIDPLMVMVAHAPAQGSPTPGALQVSAPYAAASQYVGVGVSLATPVDLTGKTLTAKVQILSGLGTALDLMTNPGGAKLYVKSGMGFVYASGTFTNLTAQGTWITIQFVLATPGYTDVSNPANVFNAADIREIGIQFDTSATTTTASPAVLLVDSVSY